MKKKIIRVALSASYYNVPEVERELDLCVFIFTTQFQNYVELFNIFGEDKVRFIPCSTHSFMEHFKNYIQEQMFPEHDVDFVEFHNLFQFNRSLNK